MAAPLSDGLRRNCARRNRELRCHLVQLASGSIAIDFVTPWLTSAIEERFAVSNRIEVGGTVLERDKSAAPRCACGTSSCAMRGEVVASAPKADVGISGFSLLTSAYRPSASA